MKVRTGFVSNSSSSSFIVHNIDCLDKENTPLLKPTIIKKLIKYGFRPTWVGHPSKIMENPDDPSMWVPAYDEDEKTIILENYGYFIMVNQEDVAVFLVKNKIPFIANIHYGSETWIYKDEWNSILMLENHGNYAEVYHKCMTLDQLMKNCSARPPYQLITVKDFLKECKS